MENFFFLSERKSVQGDTHSNRWSVGHLGRREVPGYGVVSFYRAGLFNRLMRGLFQLENGDS